MDYIIFNQPGGFPLRTNTLEHLQKFHKDKINGLGAMAGTRAILNGCEESGNKVSAGNIQIDGEMYGLIEGIKQDYITIKEDKQEYEFENGENKVTVIFRYAVFGTGTSNYKWSEFKRVPPLTTISDKLDKSTFETELKKRDDRLTALEKKTAIFTKGVRILWERPLSERPAGWEVVGGWAGKIPIVLDANDNDFKTLSATPGGKTTKIEIKHLPPHSFGNAPGSEIKSDGKAKYLSGYAKDGRTETIGEGVLLPIIPPVKVVYILEYLG